MTPSTLFKALPFGIFSTFVFATSLSTPMESVHFNEGWPSSGSSIPNMPNIMSIISAGPYSYATGLDANDNMEVAFFDGGNWHQAQSIPNLKGVSAIIPLDQNGESPAAFAEDPNNLVSYFNGTNWSNAQSINGMQYLSLQTSAGHAFAISTLSPIQSSFFDNEQQTWSAPVNLSQTLSTLRAINTANGEIYLVGLNTKGQLTEMQSSNNQDWASHIFDLSTPYLIETAATDNEILIGAQSSAQSFFSYSLDMGHSWHNITWPGGMIFSAINHGIAWDMTDNGELAYFNTQNANPTWVTVALPDQFGRVQTYSAPSSDGQELCLVGSEDDSPPKLACYDIASQTWQMIASVNKVASRLDQIALLSQNQIVASGADLQDHPTLFYFNGATWQSQHVQGLVGSIQNLFASNNPINVWATGHN